uniref:Uncharacterized protein n=1 Tax=Meloidogyne incognita TaxID=6306 RepID=A0A914LZG0_MELIC
MNEKRHFAVPELIEKVEELFVRFNSLHEPLERMRAELDESMGWHQLAFDVDVELQWIGEKKLIVECPQLGHSLTEVQQLVKRHEQLTAELDCHQPLVTDLLNKGRKLADSDGINKHSCHQEIDAKCSELSNSWGKLMEISAKRRNLLNRALSREQLLFELSEAENWLSEKNKQLQTREEGAISEGHGGAQTLLAWLKTLQNELGPFHSSLVELKNKCINLKDFGIFEEEIAERESKIEEQANALEERARLSAEHANALVNLHNLEEEQQELEQWLEQKSKILSQDDCGANLEQWEKLRTKFNDERQQIRTLGHERLEKWENEANILSKKVPEHAREVLQGQNRLHTLWELINEYIEQREASLAQAGLLYQFLRDSEELEERVREKELTLPKDLGRDAKQSYGLILKHEVFENELVQLKEEIEALVASGAQFEQLDENIQLRPLVDSWTRLQEASLHRGEQLMATYETHKFTSQVRDLLQWTRSALVEMGGEQTVNENTNLIWIGYDIRDLQTAEWLAEEHRRLRAELEGREQERSLLVNIGRDLERAGHCTAEIVHQRLSGLDQAFAAAVQWHAFQREALQILAQIQARDRSLDALEQQREFDNKHLKEDKQEKSPAHRKKELNTLICVLATLEERISRLGEMAETLEEQGHAETEQIQALTRRVTNALNELGEHTNYVKRSLDAAEELAQFEAELADLTDWLIEKEESFRAQQVASFNSSNDSGQLTNKLERLKRQQALQSELTANTPRLERLLAHKEKIYVRQRGADVKQAITRCEEFFQRWNQLLAQSKALDAALEEARDLLELEQLADRFGAYLRDKEALVQAEELGGDLEHCQTLINRLKEAHKGVDEKTLIDANTLAKKRMFNSKGGNTEASHIIDRLNDINKGWEHLSGRIHNYQALLEAALEVHRFNRDVDETNQRIGEKTSLLSAEQQAKDLAGVERLLRAQDQAERDMSAIHRKLNEHDEQAKLLLAQDPPLRETVVLDSLRKLELSWQRLAELAHARRQALQQTYSLHHFLDLVRRTDQWAQSIRTKMSGQAPSRNVAEAERALQRHAERLAEIGARDEEFRSLREFCQRLLQEQPEHRSDLQRAQRRLQTLEHQTRQYWEREQQTLERSLLFQKILAQTGQIDCWLAGKQAQLDGLTAGESPESAEAAIRELGHFIVALESQLAERFSWIDSTSKTLDSLANDHPEGSRVKERVEEIKEKCNELQKQTETKQRNLNANKHLAQFLRECAELITWMNAKLQLAMDDGYLDATALRLKLKKHLAFDAELRASEERIGRLQKRGQCLLNEEFGKDSNIGDKEESEERVRAQLEELNNGWTELLEKSAEKTNRLRSAYEAYQLGRRISESECWLERVEAIISSEDHGIDCSSAEQLLEQFENLRTEIRAKGLLIEELFQEAYKLMEKAGEDLGTNRQILYERAEALRGRWNAVDEPCQIRSQNLSEAVSFYHWADQTDEQIEWLESRVRLLESSDYGRSLHSAQSLLQKHQILEKEFSVRQPTFGQLITAGEKMLLVEMKNNNLNEENKKAKKQKGLKSWELTERLDKLHDLITLFRALASVREQRLNESLLSQEFYAEAAEAEHWMKERLIPPTNIQLTSHQQESGRQAEAQLRRCLALEKEILTFEDQLKKLGEKCERMVSADHFDLTGLQTRYGQLIELFSQLSLQCQQRKTQTTNAIRYFGFVRRADELLQWLRERLSLAEREDYGQDLEECELLAQQFHEVVRELASAGERVAQVLTLKEELLREKHPNAGSIRAKGQDVQQLWHEVNEAANERQQALIDGKNIHLFDQKADELLERLAEKEAYLLAQSEEQFGGIDLDQMFGQKERHNNEFMHSLDVLSRQVLELCAEADRIVEIFPRTSEHLEVRRGELIEQLKDVREGADRQAERQAQSQANHQYFQAK